MSDSDASYTENVPETTISFTTALAQLRDGVDTRSEENSAINDILTLASALDVPPGAFGHPKITQSIWRYGHDAETVRGEIGRAFETYALDGEPEAVVEVLKRAAEKQLSTDADGSPGQEASTGA